MRSGRRRGIRAVVDTNLFVSGTIIKRGKPFELLESWRARLFALVLCEEQRGELDDVLHRARLQKKYNLSSDEVAVLLRLLDTATTRAPLRRRLPVKVRDPKDEVILAAALGGRADYLVTGDDDLLVLRGDPSLVGLQIVAVGEFLDILASASLRE